MPEWERKPCESTAISRKEKKEICVGEVWFDVVNVAAICSCFSTALHLWSLHTSVYGAQKDGLNMISETWSEAHSWFVFLLTVVLHFSTSSPWSQRVDKQHLKSVQERWHDPPGCVMGQTGLMTARQCLAHGSSDHRYIIQFLDGETEGENPEEFKNLLKRKKKRTSRPSAHWTRKETVRVRLQVTSHKRGHSEMKDSFLFLAYQKKVPVMKTARGCCSQWLKDGISTLLVSPLGYTEWHQPFGVTRMLMAL